MWFYVIHFVIFHLQLKKQQRKQNTNHNYLAIKNYIVQYKLQYGKNKRE